MGGADAGGGGGPGRGAGPGGLGFFGGPGFGAPSGAPSPGAAPGAEPDPLDILARLRPKKKKPLGAPAAAVPATQTAREQRAGALSRGTSTVSQGGAGSAAVKTLLGA